jgi:chorismate dehydratase
MPINVARVPYLNTELFYFDMERRGIQFRDMMPNLIADAAENREIDAGPVPLVDCARLEPIFRPLSGFCIAAVSRAASSFLHSEQPIESLAGARVAVSGEDATSVSLLKVLLALKYQVQPQAYVGQEDPYDAFLLTGNQGLRRRRGVRGYPHKYDLGEEWHEWTGLPFVFARWMVRTEMERQDVAVLEDALFVGQEDWVDGLYRMTGPRDDLFMQPRDVLEYIQGHRYFMGVPEERAIELFRRYLDQL